MARRSSPVPDTHAAQLRAQLVAASSTTLALPSEGGAVTLRPVSLLEHTSLGALHSRPLAVVQPSCDKVERRSEGRYPGNRDSIAGAARTLEPLFEVSIGVRAAIRLLKR